MSSDEKPAWEVTRRGFLKGVGGVLGAAAVAGPLIDKAAALPDEAPPRKGLKKYAAAGAKITLNINGKAQALTVLPATTLLDALRIQLGLTGTKEVCDRGACGACTVLLDGRTVNSCLTLALDAIGKEVTTVEGLVNGGELAPVQQSFADHDACQCGYCIPGFVVRAHGLLQENPHATPEEIRRGMTGNICRCASYHRIFQAIEAVAGTKKAGAA